MSFITDHFHVSQGFFSTSFTENGLITSMDQLHKELPQYNEETLRGLLEIHRGPNGGRMETFGLVRVVKEGMVFESDGQTLKPSKELFALDLEAEACNPPRITIPDYLEFTAEWNPETIVSGEGNNILGDNGGLYFKESHIQIPVMKATQETLAYYGALLIPEKTAVRFPNEAAFPLWKMHVGSNYVKDYIMTEEGGGGFYLEFHHDQPHFHMVVEGGGYYLLGKQVRENTFQVTAFELSNGQAVYTKKGAIHCDAALTGDLIVGYAASNDCSTVLLRTEGENAIVQVEFV